MMIVTDLLKIRIWVIMVLKCFPNKVLLAFKDL